MNLELSIDRIDRIKNKEIGGRCVTFKEVVNI